MSRTRTKRVIWLDGRGWDVDYRVAQEYFEDKYSTKNVKECYKSQ
jgi:hypothetical protein